MTNYNKLLTTLGAFVALSAILATSLNAGIKEDVLAFQKERINRNTNIEILKLTLDYSKNLKQDNWHGYSFKVRFKIKETNQTTEAKDILFSNGKLITFDLIDIKTKKSFKDKIRPSLSKKYFNNKRLIAGSKNAKTKLVLFSDPLCPYCKDYNPDLIRHVQKYSKNVALYYFNFPISSLHKASTIIAQISVLAHIDKVKDVEYKLYTAKFNKYFLPDETNHQKILDAVNKVLGTKYTLKQINAKNIVNRVQEDIAMGEKIRVNGTPTVFINGEYTSTPGEFKNYK
jgi:protein-disulfide isomerase